MIVCPKCGKKNDDDAVYCSKCGSSLSGTSFEKQVEGFAQGVGQVGKKAGKKFETEAKRFAQGAQDFGKRMEKATDRAGKKAGSWYDRTFGIAGPLVSSFVGLIVLYFVILGFRQGATETPVLADVADVLFSYLLLLFAMMLFSGYIGYFARKYHNVQWILPISVSVVVVVFSYVVAKIVYLVGVGTSQPELVQGALDYPEKYLVMTFVIILFLGYLILVAKASMEMDRKVKH